MKFLSWLFVVLGILGLITVRTVEDSLFYDPFLDYFGVADKKAEFPDFIWFQLVINHVFRFLLNLIFSAIIIHFIFRNKHWTLQGVILISLVFLVTIPIYLYCISTKFEIGYLFSFYMRRFVIQPLILLLIIPMFYYHKQLIEKNIKH